MEGYGKRVLVVDDNVIARDLLVMLLSKFGYNVYTACSGLDALIEMRRRQFHAVISDNHMSPLSGLEFLALSALGWPETPVVMVSGDSPDVAEHAVRLGAYAWLQKPYDGNRLLEVIREAIQQATEKQAWLTTSHAS